MKAKLQAILAQLNVGLVEREQVLKTTLLAVLAGENPVLIGPPGTGKSLMARRMADALAQDCSDYFEYLLTKFSTPEEIFGPLSISELKADRFKRNTAGYLPTVKLAFLDEIFKASSSILNALLTILNERIYHNGAEPQRVPLQALIAASNELPSDQEELSALYDRFLVRVFVDYVSEAGLPHLFETTTEPKWSAETQLQGHELQRIREAAHAVQLPPEIAQAIQRIWALHRETFKEDRRESLSDRRLKKIIYLLRVSAATNGRQEVDLSDVLLLKDCLWNHPDNAVKVRELVLKTLCELSSKMAEKDQMIISALHTETEFSRFIEVRVPPLSESGTEATMLIWKKKAGEAVAVDEILIEIETDKVVLEVPAPATGVLAKIIKNDGAVVKSEDLLAYIDTKNTNNLKNSKSFEIKVPDIGDFSKVAVIELLVKVGDTIKEEQSLITVESDKASMEIPSPHAGIVRELMVGLGDKVSEGSPIIKIESDENSAKNSEKYENLDILTQQIRTNLWL